jgi:hypothetical protein
VLAGVLAVLVVLRWTGGPSEPPGREIARLFPALVPSAATHIEVRAGERSVNLTRVEGEWRLVELHDFPADRPLVERVLGVLSELTTLDLLTEDPARHVEYGLDEAVAQRLTVHGAEGALLADLLVGRAANGSAFVRRADEDAVYGASVLPRTSSDSQGWRRMVALVPIEPARVLRLELSGPELGGPDSPLVLRRDPKRHDRWLDAEGLELSRTSADSLVDAMMKLYADRVLASEVGVDEGAELGLAPPRFTVRVIAADSARDEKVVEARIGRATQDDGLVPAIGVEGPWVLGLHQASVDRLLLHLAPLRR